MQNTKKLKIAITGNIGSGKSTFASFIEEENYTVIKADEISKELLVTDEKIKQNIINEFGKESYNDEEINKKFLAEKVFSNPANVNKINRIVHPAVIKKVNLLMDEELINNNIVFVEAALIYEAKMEKFFDYGVLVTADVNIRLNRKIENDNFTKEEFYKRSENQIDEEEKMKQAEFVFTNNGSLQELKSKANILITILKALQLSKSTLTEDE